MSVTLIVTTAYGRDFNETGETISRDHWMEYVATAPDLRVRTGPHVATNPMSGETITIPASDVESEFLSEAGPRAFLRYRSGSLVMPLSFDPDDETDPIRGRVSKVADHFGALITHDAGDEILDW